MPDRWIMSALLAGLLGLACSCACGCAAAAHVPAPHIEPSARPQVRTPVIPLQHPAKVDWHRAPTAVDFNPPLDFGEPCGLKWWEANYTDPDFECPVPGWAVMPWLWDATDWSKVMM